MARPTSPAEKVATMITLPKGSGPDPVIPIE